MRRRASYSGIDETSTRVGLSGLALVVLLAVFVGFGSGPAPAGAATLQPCQATQPTGPTVELDGELSLAPVRAARKAWKRSGVRQKPVRPANQMTGQPTFPVGGVKFGNVARVNLKGGLRIMRRKRSVVFRGLHALTAAGKPAWLRGKVGQRTVNLFRIKGGKRFYDTESGQVSRVGTARLTAAGAKLLNNRLRTAKRKKLRAGTVWGYFNLYALYKVTQVEDPSAEVPPAPPVKPEPVGASAISSASTVKWFVRDSFINYVASGVAPGDGTPVTDGATADAPSGPNNLVYSFNFPFTSGWTVPETNESPENTLVKGSGTVGFRFCKNTINFTVSNPEIELDGDEASRLIFVVNGLDGTPFPNQRVVMVKLVPGQAEDHTVTDNGNGTKTVSYTKIPGFVPADASGIFAGFYPGYSPEFEGQNPRPDRFGHFSITYTYASG